ncbi:MAG: helix-turn-helix domain-containing protein, partial [Patescibacteria group bacterium]|nr:helix-turn-helix domain-containing protein [Patescibacteria group bacterium]
MDELFEKKLITTKDAAGLSGYTPDYLSRLMRSGKIEGRRVGRSWLIDNESLTDFLDKHENRKTDYARSLARAREEEYLLHQNALREGAYSTRHIEKLSKLPVPVFFGIRKGSPHTHFFALSTALLVVVFGALVAQAGVLSQLAGRASIIAGETAFGFKATFGDIPYGIASKIDAAKFAMSATNASVSARFASTSARIVSPALASLDFSIPRAAIPGDATARPAAFTLVPSTPTRITPLTSDEMRQFAFAVYAFIIEPSRITNALTGGYVALGTGMYDSINASFAAYKSLIMQFGSSALALGITERDALDAVPQVAIDATSVFGKSIIDLTQAAIGADVAVAYGLVNAAPASARITVALVGGIGDTLARASARTPALATAFFLRTTQVPATAAPALAQTVFGAEYATGIRFIAFTNKLSERYLALVSTTGRFVYRSTAGTLALAHATAPFLAAVPAALQDAYLGTLGGSALALGSLQADFISAGHAPLLAAALPALSAGEQAALFTYQTINSFFGSATGALASLFGTSNVAVVSNPSPTVLPFATSTVPARAPQPTPPPVRIVRNVAVTNYPTYTTVVKGVSEDLLNQSLAQLRTGILATVAGMVAPVAAQGVTNMTTIQQVNMIQDLSNLIVRNGDFKGGTFDSGNLTNGISVTAVTGNFTNLTGGATSLATTSITGALTVNGVAVSGGSGSGTVNSGTAGQFPYYGGSGTTLTATSSLFLASSGNLGIGTTSPWRTLSVNGSSDLGTSALAGYFTATTSTAS